MTDKTGNRKLSSNYQWGLKSLCKCICVRLLREITECEEKNTIEIDLETAEVIGEVRNNIIEITDSISLELQYPSYKMMENLNLI